MAAASVDRPPVRGAGQHERLRSAALQHLPVRHGHAVRRRARQAGPLLLRRPVEAVDGLAIGGLRHSGPAVQRLRDLHVGALLVRGAAGVQEGELRPAVEHRPHGMGRQRRRRRHVGLRQGRRRAPGVGPRPVGDLGRDDPHQRCDFRRQFGASRGAAMAAGARRPHVLLRHYWRHGQPLAHALPGRLRLGSKPGELLRFATRGVDQRDED
mmetsp:Transcript_99674/g.287756  ORF Transcript_99674/g.287756 Transcript_99674/m.287756 type:complete len:211 (+) Transcript_99674:557-1189(+)